MVSMMERMVLTLRAVAKALGPICLRPGICEAVSPAMAGIAIHVTIMWGLWASPRHLFLEGIHSWGELSPSCPAWSTCACQSCKRPEFYTLLEKQQAENDRQTDTPPASQLEPIVPSTEFQMAGGLEAGAPKHL